MPTTRSTVLGKRSHHHQDILPTPTSPKTDSPSKPPLTPEPTPKRPRVSLNLNGDNNKENIPPLSGDFSPSSAVTPRTLRRSATESDASPSRSQTTPRRRPSSNLASVTPATAVSRLTIATPPPSPPSSLQPTHIRARALLRATCNGDQHDMAGRTDERTKLTKFLSSFGQTPSSLYVSGSPGTGKTALVNDVLRELGSTLRVITVNCMSCNGVPALWDQILAELDDRQTSKASGSKKGRKALDASLAKLSQRCVIVLDELDHIADSQQSLASVFSLPECNPDSIRLIGIANTHTLTSDICLEGGASIETLHFKPYTSPQLVAILKSRLASLYSATPDAKQRITSLLPEPTLMLLSKKIATQTGDVRSLFEVLRGAIGLAANATADATEDDLLNTPPPVVTPAHILAALKAYTSPTPTVGSTENSEIVVKVKDLSLQSQLVLLSMAIASKRTAAKLPLHDSVSPPLTVTSSSSKRSRATAAAASLACDKPAGIEMAQLHTFYTSILTRSDGGSFDPIGRSEFRDLVNLLDGTGLLRTVTATSMPGTPSKSGRRPFARSSSSKSFAMQPLSEEIFFAEGVRMEEIQRGLGIGEYGDSPQDIRQEEMQEIWRREESRINRDIKTRERSNAATTHHNAFGDAVED